MLAFRNFSVCVALVSMVAFSMTGCCSGGCGLFSGRGAGQATSQSVGHSCETCSGGTSYSTPAQSFTTPQSYSAPSQTYSTQDFSGSAGSGTVNLPAVQSSGGSGSISVPSGGGSGSR